MKICLTSNGNSSDNIMDPRFGRAKYFAIANNETMKFEIIENSAAASGGGAGITSAQLMVDRGITVVITGNVGPNAMKVLKAAGIDIYKGTAVSVKKNLENFNKGVLDKIDNTVPEHFGMQGGEK